MQLEGKVVAVTGGASGIGRALCERFAAEGARGIAVADINSAGADEVAGMIGARGTRTIAMPTDVANEADIVALVERVERDLGPIDLFCSNAGIGGGGGVDASNDVWERIWGVNVMAHVYAARALVPRMAARGGGYLLTTASAAGILMSLGSAPYTVTKHAALALAEWMSVTYAEDGIRVSCLCPQLVRTGMTSGRADAADRSGPPARIPGEMLEPETVAGMVVEAIAEERFLVLPHPEVAEYERRRAGDRERWLRGMRRQWSRIRQGAQPQ